MEANGPDLKRIAEIAAELHAMGKPQKEIDFAVWEGSNGEAKNERRLHALILAQEKPYGMRGGVGRAIAEGASFGFWDELAGAAAFLVPGGKGYTEARDVSRARYGAFKDDHPAIATAAELGGSVLLPGLGAGAVGARAGAGVARSLASKVVGGIAGGAVGGALGGGAYGAGTAEEMSDVLPEVKRGVMWGGAAGAVLGGGLPIAGALAAPAVLRLGAAFAPEHTASWIAKKTLKDALRRGGYTDVEVAARMRELPPGSVLADVDPALAIEARSALNVNAGLKREGGAYSKLGQRQGDRGERIANDLRASTGIDITYEQGIRDLNDEIATIRREGYDVIEKAFPDGIVSDKIGRLVESDPDLLKFAEEVLPGYGARRPQFREMQDLLIDAKSAAEAVDMLPGKGRRLREAAQRLEDAMNESIPGFEETQAKYAAAKGKMRAYETGTKAWTKSARQIREEVAGLDGNALQAYRVGLLDYLETGLRKSETGGGQASQLMRAGPEIFEKLRVTFPTEEGFQQFMSTLQRERRWGATWNTIAGNSSSAEQLGQMMNKPGGMRGIGEAMLDLGPVQQRAAGQVGQRLLSSPPSMPPQLDSNIFMRILQMGAMSPNAQGAVAGAGAMRAPQSMGGGDGTLPPPGM